MHVAFCKLGDLFPVGGIQIANAVIVEREEGSGSADFSAHVGDGAFAGGRKRAASGAEIFDDAVRPAFYGQFVGNMENNILRRGPSAEFSGKLHAYELWI